MAQSAICGTLCPHMKQTVVTSTGRLLASISALPHFVCSRDFYRFDVTIKLASDCTEVTVSNRSTGDKWQRMIAIEYHRHLAWILAESTQDSRRSLWLQNVLDCFVDELREIPSELFTSWRSAALNPLLVRAFHYIPDDDPKQISKRASSWLMAATMNIPEWETFYTNSDVISQGYDPVWDKIKPRANNQDKDDGPVKGLVEEKRLEPVMGTAGASLDDLW